MTKKNCDDDNDGCYDNYDDNYGNLYDDYDKNDYWCLPLEHTIVGQLRMGERQMTSAPLLPSFLPCYNSDFKNTAKMYGDALVSSAVFIDID